MGFRGSKKNTPYAAQMAEDCSKVALEAGLKKSKVYVKDQETDVSLRSLHNGGIEVTEIIDVTQCLTTDVVLKDVEFNTQKKI
jgi:small subunit ribosomal protein S11